MTQGHLSRLIVLVAMGALLLAGAKGTSTSPNNVTNSSQQGKQPKSSTDEKLNIIRTLAQYGFYAEARKEFKTTIKENPRLQIPKDLKLLLFEDKFDRVRALSNLGFYTEAREEFKTIIKENPHLQVPNDLRKLSFERIPVWRKLRFPLELWGRSIFEISIALAIVYLCIVVAYLVINEIKRSSNIRLDIQDFENVGNAPEIGKGLGAYLWRLSSKQ
ncbi:hypothetical protein ACF3DV_23465 [Chlorogloeopsis fritschii PCC 9212]|uniref:Tetratricopeptide repeat protein n=1 Tax=Chlorogloeopsis fritschii PCC 6912 TaxID=211165 RepID=A0A433NQ96_CHLFR|nr:hypothetical protein [Chlorogloeopsis fritschii]RUR85973.1 hypothetical protein PCC6912_07980 [Chlorogloeopsis fritschii PCC 6912]